MLEQSKKPTIRMLCYAHRLDVLKLQQATNLDPLIIWDILREVCVTRQAISIVLGAMNNLTTQHYTIDDVHAPTAH